MAYITDQFPVDRIQKGLALLDVEPVDVGAGPAAEAGLSVYRNTIAKGCADALAAQFPTVERVVGPAWLAAAALAAVPAIAAAQAVPPSRTARVVIAAASGAAIIGELRHRAGQAAVPSAGPQPAPNSRAA